MPHKYRFERFADVLFGGCESRTLCVCRFAHKKENSLFAKLAEASEVHYLAVNRGEVYLEISRVDNSSERCEYRKRAGVRDRVIYVYKFNRQLTRIDNVACFYADKAGLKGDLVLLELVFYYSYGESCSVNGKIKLA